MVNLQARAANLPESPPVALRFSQTGAGPKLQLDLATSPRMKGDVVQREILRLILLEMMYRSQSIAPGEFYVQPPDWLLEGILVLASSGDRSSLARALVASGQVISLEDFLKQRPQLLDSAGRSLYRAYSFVLVQLLAEHPRELGRYVDNLASNSDDFAGLQKSFPQPGGRDLDAAWKSQVAATKNSMEREILSFSQSEEKLDALMRTKFTAAKGDETLSLENVSRTYPTPKQRLELKKFGQELLLLATRVNPALRSIVQEYQRIADELALGRNHRVPEKLAALKGLRTKLSARMTEIDDYVNWYEATQLRSPSGLFENEVSDNVTRSRRRDALTVYLDAMEAQF